MNSLIKIRLAPNGKVYVVWVDHPICDPAGGLLYFDNEDEACEYMRDHDAAELLGSPAAYFRG
jgi:hypothetical protein